MNHPTFAGQVHDSWLPVLEPAAQTLAELGTFLRAENDAGRGYLPPGNSILRAFTLPLDAVRVLIVGQDPYPTPGHAVGLSFSVAPDVRPVPRSLNNIFTELVEDTGCERPQSGDLTPWFGQGVMLLNRCLTVQPGKPAAHRGRGWEAITELAIRALGERAAAGHPAVAILWGRDARNLAPLLAPMPCIESPHPSPMSARHGFHGSRPFTRANSLLSEQGAEPIDWSLT
ncbi:uracil-DNA glycosylase [Kytococcus sedentarius]|uniref:uracil-DNA glycosylase n=1 Tax=Kytococcus sedentarius TaxID=1276 RepID=UPI0035BBDAC0